jgi:hypothetical protein
LLPRRSHALLDGDAQTAGRISGVAGVVSVIVMAVSGLSTGRLMRPKWLILIVLVGTGSGLRARGERHERSRQLPGVGHGRLVLWGSAIGLPRMPKGAVWPADTRPNTRNVEMTSAQGAASTACTAAPRQRPLHPAAP